MSFYHLPNPWNPGYSIPKSVLAEPPGRGTFTTRWLPRRTISQLVPDYLAKPVVRGSSLDGDTIGNGSLGSLAGSTVGEGRVYELEPLGSTPFSKGDPLLQYGKQGAAILLGSVKHLPPQDRPKALKAALDTLDKTLWANVVEKTKKFREKGATPGEALRKAIAASLSNQLGDKFVDLGKRGPRALSGYQATGIFGAVTSVVGGVTGAVQDAAKTAVNKIEKLTCKVASNPSTAAIAGGIAATQGVPPETGATGARVAQTLCGPAATPVVAPASTTPPWLLPAAIGGGALLLVLALK